MSPTPASLRALIEAAVELADHPFGDMREICFELDPACRMVGVPVFRRWDEDRDDPVPHEIVVQLWGRQASPLLEVEWEGAPFRVSSIDLPPECRGSNDYMIPFDHTPRWLSLVACDSIDIDLPDA